MNYNELKNTKPPLTEAKKPAQRPLGKDVVRYDVHGAVAHVLRKIDQHVPRVFPKMPDSFLSSLKHTIKKHAAHNGWENVAVSLSQGLAREELQDLVSREIPHIGPIVIDATGSTPEHQTFENSKLVKVNLDRLVMANESMNDILIIIYGLEGTDPNISRQLLIRRLRMTGNTLDMLRENFEWMDDQRDDPNRLLSKLERAMKLVHENLGKLLDYVAAALKKNDVKHDHSMEAQAEAFMMLVHLREALHDATDPQLRQTLENVSMQLRHIPENFRDLNFSYGPYENLAHDLMQERLAAKPVIAPPPPKAAPNPHYNDYAPRPY